MKSVGQYLVELLQSYGVDTVFGIPGVHTVEMYRGLASSRLRHVSARHEQALGFMADGYARASARVAVCFVITGPGVSNIATAMAQAYADSIPMLVISAANAHGDLDAGNGALHEMRDQQMLASSVAAFSHTVHEPQELPQVMARAFAVFDAERPRPVHIAPPLNVLHASADGLPDPTTAVVRSSRSVASATAIAEAARILASAQAPLLIAGGGALKAQEDVRALAERLGAPCIMTINARGILPAAHPLAVSHTPTFAATRRLMAQSDVVLAVGTEFGPTDFDAYGKGRPPLDALLLRIDIDAQQVFRNVAPSVAMVGDARQCLQALDRALATTALSPRSTGWGAERVRTLSQESIQDTDAVTKADLDLLDTVHATLPDALIVGDSTRMVYSGNIGLRMNRPRAWFNASVGYGALGYGLPAAVGAWLATGQPVVCLAGDGGLQFTLAEMGTASETGAHIIVLLLNNRGYGEIRNAMVASGVEPVGVDLYTPDFLAIARAYGWRAQAIRGPEDLVTSLVEAHEAGGCTLLELTA